MTIKYCSFFFFFQNFHFRKDEKFSSTNFLNFGRPKNKFIDAARKRIRAVTGWQANVFEIFDTPLELEFFFTSGKTFDQLQNASQFRTNFPNSIKNYLRIFNQSHYRQELMDSCFLQEKSNSSQPNIWPKFPIFPADITHSLNFYALFDMLIS